MIKESLKRKVALPGAKIAPTLTPGAIASTHREIELDFIRGLAMLMVLDFHAPAHLLSYPLHLLGFPNFGWAGVDVFFVLSGFLVGGLLVKEWRERKGIDGKRFLIRRGFKIWPQYYVFLGIMLLTRHRTLGELRGNLLNIQNYTGGIPHTWSLAVEEHAYLLLVLFLAIAARWKMRMRHLLALLTVTCVSVEVMRMVLINRGHEVTTATHTRIEGILYGTILAVLYHYAPDTFRKLQAYKWVWIGAIALTLIFFRFQTDAPWSSSLGWDMSDLLGVALLMLLYRPEPGRRRARAYRFVAWIGVYSYGIYLWHVSVIAPTMAITARFPRSLAPLWAGLIPIAAGIGLGIVFTKVVELPALKIRDRFFPRTAALSARLPPEQKKKVVLESPAEVLRASV